MISELVQTKSCFYCTLLVSLHLLQVFAVVYYCESIKGRVSVNVYKVDCTFLL